ncbi:MAG TPA: carboxypeptidase regulatory-like domain-containing protein, partial [Bacteroidales bacterium]|nr:carboxypeptidase regulatory-like domain-containing protein [Bacteroidales bacterium]
MKKQTILMCLFVAFSLFLGLSSAHSQGVTTGAMSGTVVDQAGQSLPGATVLAVHEPSGTRYGTSTLTDGRFTILGMRVGGPYRITVSFIGYEQQEVGDVFIALGGTTNFEFALRDAAALLGEVVITHTRDFIFSTDRTGASTTIGQNELRNLPSFSQRISDFTRLSPMASGNSFAGSDNRMNNITIDGSAFNNSFGLGGQPGERTGVAPISMSAIEAITVDIAPFDVRQGDFVGAGVNTVTRSGTNEFRGEVHYSFRNPDLVGRDAGALAFDPGTFQFNQFGFNIGGPIIRDRLFFFADYSQELLESPSTPFVANTGGQPVEGNVTRVLESDLVALSNFLRDNFGYETGPFQGYMDKTPATRFIAKLDFNLNDRNKFSLRYNHLESFSDILLSQSASLGMGTRRSNLTGLNFKNSNYQIMENIRSIVGEWNSRIGDNMFNNMIVGYTFQDESRRPLGTMFPFVDILSGGTVYTSFGFEPFTPNNELRYETWQFQNNFSIFLENHTITLGASAEIFNSENIFFPGSQSVYVYNSLADFFTDATHHLANPTRTTSPVTLRRFQVRWSNIPGQDRPIQPLHVFYAGLYAQNQWQATDRLKLTAGLRLDVPFFGDVEFRNLEVENNFFFSDENGELVRFRTDKLPDPRIHWSPRFGFNWDVFGNATTQLRGGTGIFTGSPPYVWISNQIGNNGIMTGFESLDNITTRPFHPDPNRWKPATVTGAPAASYELAYTDEDFKFPQVWRTNFAVDQRLPWGFIGTFEGIFSRDVNGIYYINSNLRPTTTMTTGADVRPLYATGTGNRLVSKVTSAIGLKNQDKGYAYNLAVSLSRPFQNGLFVTAAYSYGISRNTVDPGSIAFGSWNGNPHPGNPNLPGLGFSTNTAGHRAFGAISYTTPWATTLSLYIESRTIGNYSYIFAGDVNRDGGTANDLIYIPANMGEMNFFQFTDAGTGRVFTVDE